MKPTTTILKDCAQSFKTARGSVLEGAAALHTIFTNKLYLSDFLTFGDYVEQECQISLSFASKLVKTYEHYVVNGLLSHAKLTGTDPEKLYMAIALKGSPEKQLAQAQTLTRQELKAERADKDTEHTCTPITICSTCNRRM